MVYCIKLPEFIIPAINCSASMVVWHLHSKHGEVPWGDSSYRC